MYFLFYANVYFCGAVEDISMFIDNLCCGSTYFKTNRYKYKTVNVKHADKLSDSMRVVYYVVYNFMLYY